MAERRTPEPAKINLGPDVGSKPTTEKISTSDLESTLKLQSEVIGEWAEKMEGFSALLDDWVASGELTAELSDKIRANMEEGANRSKEMVTNILSMLERSELFEEMRSKNAEAGVTAEESIAALRDAYFNQTSALLDKIVQSGERIKEVTERTTDTVKAPEKETVKITESTGKFQQAMENAGDAVSKAMDPVSALKGGLSTISNLLVGAGKFSLAGAITDTITKLFEIGIRMERMASQIQISAVGTMTTGGVMGRDEARKLGGYLTGLEAATYGAIKPEDYMKAAGALMQEGITNSMEAVMGAYNIGNPLDTTQDERNQQLGLYRTSYAVSGMTQESQQTVISAWGELHRLGVASDDLADTYIGMYNNAQDLGVSFQELKGWTLEAAKTLRPFGYSIQESEALVGHFAGELQKGVVSAGEIAGFFTSFFRKENMGAQAAIGQQILGIQNPSADVGEVQGLLSGAKDAFALATRVRAIGEQGTDAQKQVVYEQIKQQGEALARSRGYTETDPEWVATLDEVGSVYGVSGAKLLEGSKEFWSAVKEMKSPAELMNDAAIGMNEAAEKMGTDYAGFYSDQMQAITNSRSIQEKLKQVTEAGFNALFISVQQLLARWNMGAFAGKEELLNEIAVEMYKGFQAGLGEGEMDWGQQAMNKIYTALVKSTLTTEQRETAQNRELSVWANEIMSWKNLSAQEQTNTLAGVFGTEKVGGVTALTQQGTAVSLGLEGFQKAYQAYPTENYQEIYDMLKKSLLAAFANQFGMRDDWVSAEEEALYAPMVLTSLEKLGDQLGWIDRAMVGAQDWELVLMEGRENQNITDWYATQREALGSVDPTKNKTAYADVVDTIVDSIVKSNIAAGIVSPQQQTENIHSLLVRLEVAEELTTDKAILEMIKN